MRLRRRILSVRDVTKHFGGVTRAEAASLRRCIAARSLALAGDNGAGKSTLIKTISGVYQPDEGEIVFDGEPVRLRQPAATPATSASRRSTRTWRWPIISSIGANIFLGREPMAPLFGFLPRLDREPMRKAAREVLATLDFHVDAAAGPAGPQPLRRPAPGGGDRPRHLLEGRAPDHGRADRGPGRARAAQGGRADPPAASRRTWPSSSSATICRTSSPSPTASWCSAAASTPASAGRSRPATTRS